MSKQKITEQELFAKIAKLQEQMDQSVEEGWWGDNMPELLGGDPAKAPMKMAVTPKNYARVQKMLPAMYAAAKVDPNADEIVKQRFGVYLPPYEQWDGTVPSGRGDFLTRNVFGRDGAAAGETEGGKAQQAEVERQQRVETNKEKLVDLYSKLKELVPAAFAEKAAEPAAAAPAAVATPVKESLAESMRRLSSLLSERIEIKPDGTTSGSVAPAPAPATEPAATETTPTAHPADAIIKEINDTIAAIEADDPDDEDLQIIAAIKEKVVQAQTVIQKETETKTKTDAEKTDAAADDAKQIDQQTTDADKPANAAQVQDPAAQNNRIADRMDAEAGANTAGAPQVANAQNMINSTWKQIYDLNKSIIGNNPNLIKPGQKFELPNGMGNYTVVPGDTLSGIAAGQGKGKYDTTVPPTAPKPLVPPQPKFQKELPPGVFPNTPTPNTNNGNYYKLPGAPLKSVNGTYKNLDVSDPAIRALQDKVRNDPNNASFNATVREEQSLARIVNLINYGK
jgi:hypothetical protein